MSAWTDLAAYTALPRITGLAAAADGSRLVVSVEQPDAARSRYVLALWEVPLGGGEPHRLTWSEQGERAPALGPDRRVLFVSARPGPGTLEDTPALWALPAQGEAELLLARAGALATPVVARDSGAVILGGTRLAHSTDADDESRRAERKDRAVSAILHAGMPIRHWDRELDEECARLLLLAPGGGEARDLLPDAAGELDPATWSVSADGATVAVSWRPRRPRGRSPFTVVLVDTASGERRVLADEDGRQFSGPVIAPDGSLVAMQVERDACFDDPIEVGLAIADSATGTRVHAELGDLHPTEWAWAPDSSLLFVAGDLHGRGAVVALDPRTGRILRRLAADAAYTALCATASGLFALRSAIDSPPTPVRLDPDAADQRPVGLPTPAPVPALPGRLVELEVETSPGVHVHGWLCTPDGSRPAPVMQWIHGGPFMSYNAWSWRWNPWVAVAHGWAVVLPDPALSTGYGQGCLERAWPYRADVVWNEVEAVLDAVLARPDADPERTALLGGSFGGFMTNWVAGHTDRFGAIVTHAGLWALDQQHATTDAAQYKTGIFGPAAEHPDWHARYSPHHSVEAIRTPMLVVHGNQDYRVPVSEALRLWWDLVSRWDGDPADLPHRFLQFRTENHWVLGPSNAEIWYATVLGFCGEHVLSERRPPHPLL